MMEDVDEDYVLKTVTIDPHPFHLYSHDCISIHPCMHAATMERMLSMMEDGGKTVREDQYLFLHQVHYVRGALHQLRLHYGSSHSLSPHCLFMTDPLPRFPCASNSPLAKSNVIVVDIETSESRFGFAGDESTQVSDVKFDVPIRSTCHPILYITPK